MGIKSVKTKISVISAVTIIIGVAAVLVFMYVSLMDLADKQARAQLKQVGETFVNLVSSTIDQPSDLARTTAEEAGMYARTGILDRVSLAEHFETLVQDSGYINGFGVMFEKNAYDGQDAWYTGTDYGMPGDGRISYYYVREGQTASFQNHIEDDESDFDQGYYRNAFDSGKISITKPYLYTSGGKSTAIVTTAAPVKDAAGNPIGVTLTDIYLDSLFAAIKDEKIFETGYLIITDYDGNIVYSPNESDLLKLDSDLGLEYNYDETKAVFDDTVMSAVNGKQCLAVTLPVWFEHLDDIYYVSVAAPLEEINADANKLLITTIIALVVLATVLVLVVYLGVSSSLKPLARIKRLLGNVANGDFSEKVDPATVPKDEIGDLIHMIQHTSDQVDGFVNKLHGMSEALKEGEIDARIDTDGLSGEYHAAGEGVNDMVGDCLGDTLALIGAFEAFGGGRFDHEIPKMPGKKALMNEAFENVRDHLKEVAAEINECAEHAHEGDLKFSIDTGKYSGEWANIMNSLNGVLKAVESPIAETIWILNKISEGHFNERVKTEYQGDYDRIKHAANSTAEAVSSYIKEITEVLQAMAVGDMTKDIYREYIGDFTAIKEAINGISASLNRTLGEIGSASAQVLMGSKQISTSAMTLAQGATEQASSVQELNAMVEEINRETGENADNAKQAAKLAAESKTTAETGNSDMAGLLEAMEGITRSSQKISNIIKTIEDIASQTNLLALNAAVEAARAGEHGKGFTVVAGEVRSLAEKSQQAAQETNDLIQESIDRVNQGTNRANETAKSLEKIVGDVGSVSEVISKISLASIRQKEAIGNVSIGLTQISQVVQSNSATSQESAAASEELNSQAETLQEMVAFFKTK